MWNLANALTLSRFITAPIFLLLLLHWGASAAIAWAAFVLLGVTLLTDMLDGMAARAQKQVTDFGKIMDPVADSTFFLTAILGLYASPRFAIPVWVPLIVIYREIAMHVLRRYAALRGVVLAAKVSGKAKMVVQSVLLLGLTLAAALVDSGAMGTAAEAEKALQAGAWWIAVTIAAVNVLSLPEYLMGAPALLAPNEASS
jgi:CDP-diacylglycerol--glycerol-3-phosphate 3-phosphatidyltransferase